MIDFNFATGLKEKETSPPFVPETCLNVLQVCRQKITFCGSEISSTVNNSSVEGSNVHSGKLLGFALWQYPKLQVP